MWWIAVATVQAASFPTENLDGVVAETRAAVAAVLGRDLDVAPTLRITVTEKAEAEIRAGVMAAFPGSGPEEVSRAVGWGEKVTPNAIYTPYGPTGSTMYLLDDRYARLFPTETPDEARLEVVRCSLAHELTHAIQFAQPTRLGARSEADHALIEGQATWVAGQVCKGAGLRLMRQGKGMDVLASTDPAETVTFRYAYGERFVGSYVARWGVDALWSLLAASHRPSREEIIRVVQAQLARGWANGAVLTEVYARETGLDPSNATVGPDSPGPLLPDAVAEAEGAPSSAIAGIYTAFRTNTRRASLRTYLFEAPAAAEALVRARRAALAALQGGGRALVFTSANLYSDLPHSILPLLGRERPVGMSEGFASRMKIGGNEWYDELWVAVGPQVVGATWEGRAPGAKLAAAVRDVYDLALPTTSPRLEGDPEAVAILETYGPRP